jgi:hypothetical protein
MTKYQDDREAAAAQDHVRVAGAAWPHDVQ